MLFNEIHETWKNYFHYVMYFKKSNNVIIEK
jgi:hypothetical protein